MAATTSQNGVGHERRFSYGLVDDPDLSDHSGTFSCEQQVKHPRDKEAEALPDPELDMFDLVEKRYQLRQGLIEPSYVNKTPAKVIETSLSDYFDVEEQDEYLSDGREALELLVGKNQGALSENELQNILAKLNLEGNMIFDTPEDDYSYLDNEDIDEASAMIGKSRHHSHGRARRHKVKDLDLRVQFEDVELLEEILQIEDDAVRHAEYSKYSYAQEMRKCLVPIARSPVDVKAELRIFPKDTSGHDDEIRRLNEKISQIDRNNKKQLQTESSDNVLKLLQSAGLSKILSRTPTPSPTPPPTIRKKAASEEPEKDLGRRSNRRSISREARSVGSRRSFDFGVSRRTKLKRHNSQPPAPLDQWTADPIKELIAQTASIKARASDYEVPVPDQIPDLVESIEKMCEQNWMICPVDLSQATQQQLVGALDKANVFARRRRIISEVVNLHEKVGPAMAKFYNAKYEPISGIKLRDGTFMTYEELNAVFVKAATHDKLMQIYFQDEEKARKKRQEEEEAAKKKEAAQKLAHQRELLLQQQKLRQQQEHAAKQGPSTPPASHGDPVKKSVPKSGGKSPQKQKIGVPAKARFDVGQLEKMVDNSLIGQITEEGKATPPPSMGRLPSPSKSPTRPSLAGAFDPPAPKPAQATAAATPAVPSSSSQSQPPTGPKNAFGAPSGQQAPPTEPRNAFGQPSLSQSQSGQGGAFGGGMGAFGQPSGGVRSAGAFSAFGQSAVLPKSGGGLGGAFGAPTSSPNTSAFGAPSAATTSSGQATSLPSVRAPESQAQQQQTQQQQQLQQQQQQQRLQQQQQQQQQAKQSQLSQSANNSAPQTKTAGENKVNDSPNPEVEHYKRILAEMKALKKHVREKYPDTYKGLAPLRAAINRSVGQISIEVDHTNELVAKVKHALFSAAQNFPTDQFKLSRIMLPHLIHDAQQRNLQDPDIHIAVLFLLYHTVKAVFDFMEDNHEKKPMIKQQMCYFTYRIFCEPYFRGFNFVGILMARIYRKCPMLFGEKQLEVDEYLEPTAIIYFGVSKFCSQLQYEKNAIEAIPLITAWASVADLVNKESVRTEQGRVMVLKVFVETGAVEFVRRWKGQGMKLLKAVEQVARPKDDYGRLLKDAVEKLFQG